MRIFVNYVFQCSKYFRRKMSTLFEFFNKIDELKCCFQTIKCEFRQFVEFSNEKI